MVNLQPLFQGCKTQKKRCNHILPAQVATMPETPNCQPYLNHEAEKNMGQSYSTSKSAIIAIAQQCNH